MVECEYLNSLETKNQRTNIILFLFLFLLTNIICFIPSYLFYFKEGKLLELPNAQFLDFLFIRESIDLMRIVPEFVLLFFFLSFWGSRNIRIGIKVLFYVLGFLFLVYNIYFFFYFFVYSIHPNFIQDFYLTKEVLPVFISSIGMASILNYIIAAVILFVGLAAFYFLMRYTLLLFEKLDPTIKKYIFGPLLIYVLMSLVIHPGEALSRLKTSQWTVPRIIESFAFSKDNLQNKLKGKEKYSAHLRNNLIEKPDLYFIFVESYGTVASLTKENINRYDSLLLELDESFAKAQWNIASNYSIAPIIGGKSWLSFSTVMAGVKMYEHTGYNEIIQNQKKFPHLINYLNGQSYETYRMNTFKANEKTEMKIPYEVLDEFWDFDHWIKFKDIPYSGYEYDIFGGIPDQYALGYLQDSLIVDSLPTFSFFITMNSHGPWFEPPPILENWKDLDTIKSTPHEEWMQQKGSNNERYFKSIIYQLKMLEQFILKKVDQNSIVVLIGDHNPAGMEYKLWKIYNKFATQIHVFSKDKAFTDSFLEYNFDAGMHIDINKNKLMKHEGFYSLFQRMLIKHYGKNGAILPDYLPNGLEATTQKESEKGKKKEEVK